MNTIPTSIRILQVWASLAPDQRATAAAEARRDIGVDLAPFVDLDLSAIVAADRPRPDE